MGARGQQMPSFSVAEPQASQIGPRCDSPIQHEDGPTKSLEALAGRAPVYASRIVPPEMLSRPARPLQTDQSDPPVPIGHRHRRSVSGSNDAASSVTLSSRLPLAESSTWPETGLVPPGSMDAYPSPRDPGSTHFRRVPERTFVPAPGRTPGGKILPGTLGADTLLSISNQIVQSQSRYRSSHLSAIGVEVWVFQDHCSLVDQQSLHAQNVRDWVYKTPPKGKSAPVAGLRLIICTRDDRSIPVSELPFDNQTTSAIAESFRLPRHLFKAAQEHNEFLTTLGGLGKEYSNLVLRMLSFGKDGCCLGLSYNANTRVTQCLLLGLVQDEERRAADEVIAKIIQSPTHAWHPLFLPTVLVEMRSVLASSEVRRLAQRGFQYELSDGRPPEFLGDVNDEPIPGLTNLSNKIGVIEHMLESVLGLCQKLSLMAVSFEAREVSAGSQPGWSSSPFFNAGKTGSTIHGDADYLHSSNEGLLLRVRQIRNKIQLQLSVWRNWSAERDNDLNLSMANDSKRDSTSMKVISILGMVFLPATFVASFFAMPLLNWAADNGGSIITDHFWMYWVITVPLTAFVLAIWLLWLWLGGPPHIGRHMKHTVEAQENLRSKFLPDKIV